MDSDLFACKVGSCTTRDLYFDVFSKIMCRSEADWTVVYRSTDHRSIFAVLRYQDFDSPADEFGVDIIFHLSLYFGEFL